MKIDPNQLVGALPPVLEIAARLIAGMEAGPREQYMEGHRRAAYWGLDRARALLDVYSQTEAREVAALPCANEFTDIVFDGPPSHEGGRFVEVEDHNGRSVSIGEWVESGDGYWRLRLRVPADALAAARDAHNATAGEVAGG